MNRRAYIFYLIVFICGFVITFFCGYKYAITNPPKTVENNVSPNAFEESNGYWILTENNHVMVYNYDKSVLIADTEIDVSKLSDLEQAILLDGIYIENPSELFKYLEAYTS